MVKKQVVNRAISGSVGFKTKRKCFTGGNVATVVPRGWSPGEGTACFCRVRRASGRDREACRSPQRPVLQLNG